MYQSGLARLIYVHRLSPAGKVALVTAEEPGTTKVRVYGDDPPSTLRPQGAQVECSFVTLEDSVNPELGDGKQLVCPPVVATGRCWSGLSSRVEV